MRFLYTIGICIYALGVRIAALFGNEKARLWVKGRQALSLSKFKPVTELKTMGTVLRQAQEPNTDDWVWFHAASLGEFEQGRPVIEAWKKTYPEVKILLSFFSPSGYEVRKDYPLADEVLYLPIDTPHNARAWVQSRHFIAVFFIKYDFWFNYMRALKQNRVPLFYISLILNEKSFFFKPYGRWFRNQLWQVRHFFVQDQLTGRLLQNYGFDNHTVCGDTRFDRVADIARQAERFPVVEGFKQERLSIIAGSTWPPDEKLLAHYLPLMPEDYCLILAPHDISESHIAQIKALFPEAQRYTEYDASKQSKVLIVDTIGILSQLYQYADFVYIGGGFGVNIHNIQEPVTFGCPVVFGPKYKSFKEAVDLVDKGGAFSVSSQEELNQVFTRLINDQQFHRNASETCMSYLEEQLGATATIMKKLSQLLLGL